MPEAPNWPKFFSSPAALQAWLYSVSKQHPGDKTIQKHLITLRWLVLAEMERHNPTSLTTPDYAPKPEDFITPPIAA